MAKAAIQVVLKNGTSQVISVNADLGKKVSEHIVAAKPSSLHIKDDQGNLVYLNFHEIAAVNVAVYD